MFDHITQYPDDPIEELYIRAAEDRRDNVLNLGIGVYRDSQGRAPIFDCVKTAEQYIVDKADSKSYLTPLGNERFIEVTEKLLFGEQHPVISEGRVISAQCPGAGGGLRIGAELLKSISPHARVWFSAPVWEHQIGFFTCAGLQKEHYQYYDRDQHRIDFPAMLASVDAMNAGDLMVIHGCCHNPTGADLSLEQWKALTERLIEKQVIPFVDIAYQGFGVGIEDDVLGTQWMAAHTPNMLLAYSASKSFGLYRDRAGLFSLIHNKGHQDGASLKRYLRDLIRGLYFMPPDHAASVVAEILLDPTLKRQWRTEVDGIRQRVRSCREALAGAIDTISPDFGSDFIRSQKGMFSCFNFTEDQLRRLEQEFRIYLLPGGRLNFAAMTHEHASRIAQAICSV